MVTLTGDTYSHTFKDRTSALRFLRAYARLDHRTVRHFRYGLFRLVPAGSPRLPLNNFAPGTFPTVYLSR
jgi:hypothetical protein